MDEIFKRLSLEELLSDYRENSRAWYWISMAYMSISDKTTSYINPRPRIYQL